MTYTELMKILNDEGLFQALSSHDNVTIRVSIGKTGRLVSAVDHGARWVFGRADRIEQRVKEITGLNWYDATLDDLELVGKEVPEYP